MHAVELLQIAFSWNFYVVSTYFEYTLEPKRQQETTKNHFDTRFHLSLEVRKRGHSCKWSYRLVRMEKCQ